jgi:hypothetical protein
MTVLSGEATSTGGRGDLVDGSSVSESCSGSAEAAGCEEKVFDFTLSGPMWWEFVMASNAYGRGLRSIFLPFAPFFGIFVVLSLQLMVESSFTDSEAAEGFVIFSGLTLLCLSLCGGPLACWGVANKVVRFVSGWFPVRGLSTVDIWRVLIQRRRGDFDSRWSTPCRLTVDGDGLILERWVEPCGGGEAVYRVVGVSWRRLDCVRLTEHAVVFSPSAGDESSMDVSPAVAHVEAADLDGCVLVDRSVVPDLDGFVSWCRARVGSSWAGPRHAPGGPRGMGVMARLRRRYRRWVNGDDEFLDGPPRWMKRGW